MTFWRYTNQIIIIIIIIAKYEPPQVNWIVNCYAAEYEKQRFQVLTFSFLLFFWAVYICISSA